MVPDTFVPPIHLFNMLIFGKVAGEPRFIAKWDKIRDIGTKTRDCVDVKMVIVRTTLLEVKE